MNPEIKDIKKKRHKMMEFQAGRFNQRGFVPLWVM